MLVKYLEAEPVYESDEVIPSSGRQTKTEVKIELLMRRYLVGRAHVQSLPVDRPAAGISRRIR
jgi:hypothetical protein